MHTAAGIRVPGGGKPPQFWGVLPPPRGGDRFAHRCRNTRSGGRQDPSILKGLAFALAAAGIRVPGGGGHLLIRLSHYPTRPPWKSGWSFESRCAHTAHIPLVPREARFPRFGLRKFIIQGSHGWPPSWQGMERHGMDGVWGGVKGMCASNSAMCARVVQAELANFTGHVRVCACAEALLRYVRGFCEITWLKKGMCAALSGVCAHQCTH